jgi:homocysteine-responsive ER-resident protein 1 with ubiquitin-like domain
MNFMNPNFNLNNMAMMTNLYGGASGLLTPEQMMQQMMVMQQMYAQFVAQYQMQGIPGIDVNQMPVPFPIINPAETVAAAPLPAAPVRNVQPDQPPVQLMNANQPGAAVVDDDGDVNRDWLDWFYWGSRAVVLFSIVYFYSSFSRLLVVVGLAFIMYLYQIGWLFQRQDRNVNGDEVAAGRNHNQGDANAQMIQEMMDGDIDRPARRDDAPTETERFSGLRLFWVIVSSLFTSLIPEQVGNIQ